MRPSISFFHLFEEAVRTLLQSRPLLLMGIPFGITLYFSMKGSELIAPLFPTEVADPEAILTSLSTHQETLFTGIALLVFLGALRTALRGPLFLLIEKTLLQKLPSTPSPSPSPLNGKQYLKGALIALLFEALYWLLLIIFGLILFSPLLIASKYNPGVVPSLFQMGTIILLMLGVIFFYIKEFGFLYALLAHIKPRLAIELGLKLFKKHAVLSLLFGLFLIALSFLFTFFLNLAMITSALIAFWWPKTIISTLCGIGILGFTALLTETLRLLFFHALAATPQIKVSDLGKVIEEKKGVPEAPIA